MLNNILDIVKDAAYDVVSEHPDVPRGKKKMIVDTAASAITSGLSNNISSVTKLLTGGGINTVVDSIQKSVVTSLSEKVGLNASVAGDLASAIVPAVMNALNNKVESKEDKEFSVESVLGALSGGSQKRSTSILDNLLGGLASLFSK